MAEEELQIVRPDRLVDEPGETGGREDQEEQAAKRYAQNDNLIR
jgi:hypothetical protein